MDPLERVDINHDTTFVFMLEAGRRGHRVIYLRPQELSCRGNVPAGLWRDVEVRREAGNHFSIKSEERKPLSDLDVLFLRVDPPFTMDYVFDTYFAELAEGSTFVINSPRGIRDCSEKFFAMHFPELIPPSLITQNARDIRSFIEEMGGEAIIKPVDSFGGEGVFYLTTADKNLSSILEMSLQHETRRVVVQKFIPEVTEGDKRLLLLNGEYIGGIRRLPPPGETRSNLHIGGTAAGLELSARDKEICAAIGPTLREYGLYFVGLDVIGDYLTEVNVTSPTCVQEANKLSGVELERQVLDFVEEQAAARRAA